MRKDVVMSITINRLVSLHLLTIISATSNSRFSLEKKNPKKTVIPIYKIVILPRIHIVTVSST